MSVWEVGVGISGLRSLVGWLVGIRREVGVPAGEGGGGRYWSGRYPSTDI